MIYILATSYMSLTKAILCTLLLLVWAAWAALVDKDADYFRQKRRMWNAIQVAAAALGFIFIFLIPWFIVGFLLGALAIGGAGAAYAVVRNKAVGEKDRWKLDAEFFLKMLNSKRQERAEKAATLKFKSASGAPMDLKPVPMQGEPRYPAHLMIEEILEGAMQRHAQGVTLAGGEAGFAVTMSIDGVEFRQRQVVAAEAMAAIKYLKMHCAMETGEIRKPLMGRCSVESAAHGTHELRVKTAGSTKGLTCSIAFDALKQISIGFKDLGLLDSQMAALEPVLQKDGGVVVVATPPQQGRTTTLYALTQTHDPFTLDIHTVETEVEREIDSVTHNKVEPAEQWKRVKSLLIRDPHVVTVVNVPDSQAAKVISEGGTQNKRMYAGLKADDTFSALKMWLKAVGDNDLVARSLYAVVSQRLVRKLCPVCRVKYRPDAAALKKLNLPADKIKELYKAGGKIMVKEQPQPCPACSGVGYQGRFAAFEVLVVDDDEARKFITAGDLAGLRTHVRRKKTQWLDEAALAKVVSGVTSIAEAMRAMGADKQEIAAASGSAAAAALAAAAAKASKTK